MTSMASGSAGLGWLGVIRLGTVQAALGAMVMVATSLINRVMVVEYAIVAAVPAALVAWHYAAQICRPLWGHRSDRSAHRTPWIVWGMGILALGTLLAVDATIFMREPGFRSYAFAFVGFTMIGLGIGMSGTALLALLASRVVPERKPAAAAICWTMMIAGIVIAAGTSGSFLDPYSEQRLAIVCSFVVLGAFCAAMVALRGIEERYPAVAAPKPAAATMSFGDVLREIWADGAARRFTWFVFIAMLAYSMQDLVLEPFAGLVFGMSPGESTRLSGLQHSGILVGMLVAGVAGSFYTKRFGENLKLWIMMGCVGSAVMLAGLALAANVGLAWPLKANIFGLGVANGIFAVSAVGAMLGLASDGKTAGEGARMGVWGASQAIAFGLGGLIGAVLVDQLRRITGEDSTAFITVFALEAALFLFAAIVATGTPMQRRAARTQAVAA